jgi:hypothetical protein
MAERKVAVFIVDLAPLGVRYRFMQRYLEYSIGTLRNIVSSLSTKLWKHGWQLVQTYDGKVLEVTVKRAPHLRAIYGRPSGL